MVETQAVFLCGTVVTEFLHSEGLVVAIWKEGLEDLPQNHIFS